MTSRALLLLALALAMLVRPAAQETAPSQNDPPTLVIVGTGMFADIGGPHAKTDQMLYHTLQMFHAGARGMRPTSVRFEQDTANFTISMPNVENGRVTGSHQEGVAYPADSSDPAAMQDAARLVAAEVASNRQAIVAMDMDLLGLDVVAARSLGAVAARAANAIRNSMPGANAAYEMTLAATGQPSVPHDFQPAVDAVETNWNRETRRAAVFMEATAREFKARNGPNARVILVGHSAFTDAIDQVPMRDGGEQLVDMRVLSSERPRPPRETDADRTVFIAHGNDLPPTRMGNPLSPTLVGDLKNQGTVVTLDGYSYVGWDESPVVLAAETLKDVSPGAALVAGIAREAEQIIAHSATYLYKSTFDMKVCRGDECVDHRGTPSDIVDLQSKAIFSGNSAANVTRNVIGSLEQEKPKESPVGGISLTKPADVPVRPSDVERLTVDTDEQPRLVLELRSGERLRLPAVDPSVLGAAVKCVYGEGRGPELSLEGARFDDRNVMAIRYVCEHFARTQLATLMLEADRALGSIAWGQGQDYRAPPIDHYQPYAELALDDPRIDQGTLAGRVWLVPSAIRLRRDRDDLIARDVTQSIRFEFWDPDKTTEYLGGAKIGVRTPAGDYLGARLTSEINEHPDSFREVQALREPVVLIGTLLWARAAGIELGGDVMSFADNAIAGARTTYQIASPAEEIVRDNNVYHLVPEPALRTVSDSSLSKPAIVFGPSGPTRFLWEDGSESRITYEKGRVMALTSRHGGVSHVLYSDDGELQAIVGPDGIGIAMIPREGFSIMAAGVPIDLSTRVARIPHDATLAVDASPRQFLDNQIAKWLAAERANQTSTSLLILPSASTAGSAPWNWSVLLWIVGALVAVPLTWNKRKAIASIYWHRRINNRNARQPGDAVAHLLTLGGPRSEAALLTYMSNAYSHNGHEALEAMSRSGNATARAVLRGLLLHSTWGDEAAERLDRLDPTWRLSAEARAMAADLLSHAGAQHPDREPAIAALGRLHATAAVPSIIDALSDIVLRWTASRALSTIGAASVQPLLGLLSEQGDDRRKMAWDTLNRIAGWASLPEARAAVPDLLEGLHHRYSLIRQDCVRALGRIGDPRALHPLLDAVHDEKDRVRTQAIEALGYLGDKRAVPELRKTYQTAHSVLAASALARLGERDPEILADVIAHGTTAEVLPLLDAVTASDSADLLKPQVLTAFLNRLIDADDDVRRKAYEVLASVPKRWTTTPATLAFAKHVLDTQPPFAFRVLYEIGESLIPELVARLEKNFSALALDLLLSFNTFAALPAFRQHLWGPKATDLIAAIGKHRDVASLDVLLEATRNDQQCSSAVAAIESILEHRAKDVSKAILERAAALQDRDWIEYIPYTGPCNFEGETYSHRLDCGRVRQLAKQELLRRGRKA